MKSLLYYFVGLGSALVALLFMVMAWVERYGLRPPAGNGIGWLLCALLFSLVFVGSMIALRTDANRGERRGFDVLPPPPGGDDHPR